MKKILAILMTLCLVACALCVTTYAADEPAPGTVLRVRAKDKKTLQDVVIQDYTKFDEGWEGAIDFAESEEQREKYSRVIVDFYADWTANEDGVFGDSWRVASDWGDGFQYSTIYVPEKVNITLNLNGHTIKRVLPDSQSDGEVIYIDEDADVIINNGTITGGKSTNGAGGIHINGARVELNDVHIVGNVADNDDGAGIAAYDATVIMRGGSLSNNTIDSVYPSVFCYGGGLYAEDSEVTLENVEIKNNQTLDSWSVGMGIYVEECKVTVDRCIFDGNGVGDTDGEHPYPGFSTVYANDSNVTITKTTFINNGSPDGTGLGNSVLFEFDTDSHLEMDECVIKNNAPVYLFDVSGTGRETCSFYVKNTTITDNASAVIGEDMYISGCFENCTFNNNEYPNKTIEDFSPISDLVLRNCSMGDSSYDDSRLENIEFQDADGKVIATGSIFGEGSLTMIVAILALALSAASMGVTLSMKKILVPEAANQAESENE